MAIYGTLVNKVTASKLYSNKSLSDPDLDNNRGKGFSTYNTAPKPAAIAVHISSTLVVYTKVQYIGLSKRLGWVLFFYIKVIPGLYPAYIWDLT